MAKTFEAIQKYQKNTVADTGSSSGISKWDGLTLNDQKSLADILNKISIGNNSNSKLTLHFASAREGEGTSTILVNLANYMIHGDTSQKILFIDGNIENPVFDSAFHLPRSPGLLEVLKKKCKLTESVYRIKSSCVFIMPCGDTVMSSSISLESAFVVDFVKALQQEFQVIIFDSPPLLSSPVSILWASVADESLMVIQANQTQWEVAKRAQLILEKNQCKIGGVVLNRVKYSIPKWLYKRL